jgi:glycosyltransferase involved in cell wall biosynthesis
MSRDAVAKTQDDGPTISVVVAVLNAANTLSSCIAALAEQDYSAPRVELIFVDNGSTDGSLDLLQSARGIHALQESRPGAYAARNAGAAAATGDILAFTDPDCIVAPGWLNAVAHAFESPSCSVALGMRRPSPDVGLNRLLGDYEVAKDQWMLSAGDPRKCYGYTNTMAVRRAAWERCGPFDDRPRGADTIFVRRVVDTAGCHAVRWEPGMRVSHLEVDGPLTYFLKAYTYGRSMQSYRHVVPVSPLSFRDRLYVFGLAVRANKNNPILACLLFVLLAAGGVAWSAGRVSGFLRQR